MLYSILNQISSHKSKLKSAKNLAYWYTSQNKSDYHNQYEFIHIWFICKHICLGTVGDKYNKNKQLEITYPLIQPALFFLLV